MDIHEIVRQLETIEEGQRFPFEAVAEAVRQREAITPILLQSLDDCFDHAQEDYDSDIPRDLTLYSMYLLAQFREQLAFPKLLKLMALDHKLVDFVFGDALTESLYDILYSTYNGDLTSLLRVIEDKTVEPFARSAAVRVLIALYLDGTIKRSDMVDYLRRRMKLSTADEDVVPDTLAEVAEELHLFELVEDVRKMFGEDKMDLQFAGDFAEALNYFYDYSERNHRTRIITDAAKELSGWAVFARESENRAGFSVKELEERLKTGRNEPCPCGSGRKYKKCCLRKDEEQLRNLERMLADDWVPQDKYPAWDTADTDRPGLLAHYDKAALEVDEPAYRGMKLIERRGPFGADAPEKRKNGVRFLLKAFALFQELCNKEGILSLEEYDRRYKVHYLCHQWLETLLEQLKETHDPRADAVEDTLTRMAGQSAG